MSHPVLMTGRGGLGDAIYARPFVREALRRFGHVFVETSWPEMFANLGVRCVKRRGGLAVQAFHGEHAPASAWSKRPGRVRMLTLKYRWSRIAKATIWEEMEGLSHLHPPLALDLPPLPVSPLSGRYAVIRPPAVRCDYPAPAREPEPDYLARAAEALQARGYRVASLGWFVPGLEEPNGCVPADVRWEYGELPLMQAVALVAEASVVVSAPCWLVPACVASCTPHVVIAGGCGGRNSPRALIDRRLGADHVRWLMPERYCMCAKRHHACPKDIADFDAKFAAALDGAETQRAA